MSTVPVACFLAWFILWLATSSQRSAPLNDRPFAHPYVYLLPLFPSQIVKSTTPPVFIHSKGTISTRMTRSSSRFVWCTLTAAMTHGRRLPFSNSTVLVHSKCRYTTHVSMIHIRGGFLMSVSVCVCVCVHMYIPPSTLSMVKTVRKKTHQVSHADLQTQNYNMLYI